VVFRAAKCYACPSVIVGGLSDGGGGRSRGDRALAFAALVILSTVPPVGVGCSSHHSDAKDGGPFLAQVDGGDAHDLSGDREVGPICTSDARGQKAIGDPCGCGADCASNFCVDGVCCNTACTETCKTCAAPSAMGTCTFAPAGVKPRDAHTCAATDMKLCGLDGTCDGAGACRQYQAGTVCAAGHCEGAAVVGGQVCDGSGRCRPGPAVVCAPFGCSDATAACFDRCDQNSDCASGRQCTNHSCGKKLNGARCATGDECASTFCADGLCCNVACEGGCVSCALAGRGGTCWPVDTAAPDPRAICTDQGEPSCGKTGRCDGFGGCDKYPAETRCLAPMCAGAVRRNLPGVCDGRGTCTPPGVASCSPNLCLDGDCQTSCLTDAQCEPGHACINNSCGKIKDGNACKANADCVNAHCVDGVCCDTACTGSCRSCALAATLGKCTPTAAGNPDPRGLCKDLGKAQCSTNGQCDGAGACQNYPIGTVCAPESCGAGVYTPPSACNASGTCMSPDARPCSPYVCNGSACFNACTGDANCQTPRVCNVNSCGKKPLGAACSAATECQSTFCAQGVCCNSGCNGSCLSCALPGTVGTCSNTPTGSADPAGICKDTGKAGCGTTGKCQAGICQKYARGTVCKDPTCNAATNQSTAGSTCDGAGACTTPAATTCAPYKCGVAVCKGSCTAATTVADCSAPNICNGTTGLCGLKANGQACGDGTECLSKFCAQGFCCNSACGGACQSCAVAGALGTCSPVAVGPSAQCTKMLASTCQTDGFCDGKGACRLWPAGTECAAQTCADVAATSSSTETFAKSCDGAGACKAPTPATTACGSSRCKGTACVVTCGSTADCWTPNVCNGNNSCGPKPLGQLCFANAECASNACTEGVCCVVPGCPACQTCNKSPATAGTCQNVAGGQPDPNDRCQPQTSCAGLNYTREPACTGSGTCGGATFESCDDGDACTTDSCKGDTGCSHAAKAGLSCGNMCLPPGDCCTNADCQGLQTCGGGGTPNVCGCTPTTCKAHGKNCDMIPNGCGGPMLNCGTCATPATCGGSGTANLCGCTPTTCKAQVKNCGMIPDGCGGAVPLDCGSCTAALTSCGGGGVPNVCGCTPTTCAAHNMNCGALADGCGGMLSCGSCVDPQVCNAGVCGNKPCVATTCGTHCGSISDGCGGTLACATTCPSGQSCGGGGTPNVCGCTPTTCGTHCGSISDGCGGTLACATTCPSGQTCGGGGTPNVCGCIPTSCDALGAKCGTPPDGCGGTLPGCGSCTKPDETCGGGGAANICGCTPTTSCAQQSMNCGSIPDDGCGNILNCGTCMAPLICGTNNVCACAPTTCAAQSKNCDTIANACGGTLNCGPCTLPATCGGGPAGARVANVCGCTPLTCPASKACGTLLDGCGHTLNCGTCTGQGETCSDNNVCGCIPATKCPGPMTCGTADDGCGHPLNCGSCTSPQICTSGNTCCTPKTCDSLNANCGAPSDGCGGALDCGTCPDLQTCGARVPNVCDCIPRTTCPTGKDCGLVDNGCGGMFDCGGCSGVQTCGARTPNVCDCVRLTSCGNDQECGTIPDGCGGTVNCGNCPSGQKCGTGNKPNSCCVPKTCGQSCGTMDDGCGGTLDCGGCDAPKMCGGGGTPNACGCTPTMTSCPGGFACGTVDDGCGHMLNCGTCDDGPACTDVACNASHQCVYTPHSDRCDDGSACTTDVCDKVMGCVFDDDLCPGLCILPDMVCP
jgi:hypothetical protein